MLTRADLIRLARREDIGLGRLEHEYVILCLLDTLASVPLGDDLALKGGTALRQFYFPDWRYSEDLDFSSLLPLDATELEIAIECWFAHTEEVHTISLRLRRFHRADGTARLRGQYRGPLEHPAPVLFDFTLDEPILLPPVRRPVVASPFPAPPPVVLVYTLEELLAEKMRSILQRGKARDYYDVWRLLKEGSDHFDAPLVRAILPRKCAVKDVTPLLVNFLTPSTIEEARPYWDSDLAPLIVGALPPFDNVVAELCSLLAAFLG